MPDVKGVILAGGEGTRLRPITYYFQKCMMPVGYEQRPVLEYIIRLFEHNTIDDLVLLVGYKHQQIVNYFNTGKRFGVKITYVIDDPDYKGSANAIVHAYREGFLSKNDQLIIYYGDILSSINLRELLNQHLSSDAAVTVAMAGGYKIRVGTAVVDKGGRIKKFVEKPELETPACIGILTMSGKVLEEMDAFSGNYGKETLDLMGDLVPHLIERNRVVNAYITDAFWYDIGSIESYEKLSNSEVEEQLNFLPKKETEKAQKDSRHTKV